MPGPGTPLPVSDWIRTIWHIALLRAGPQDLPGGRATPVLALIAYAAIILASRAGEGRAPGAADFVVSLFIPLVLTALLLWLQGRWPRLRQTVGALFGTGALISLVNVPLWFTSATPVPAPLVLLALAGLFWSLAVDGHIWRHALDCSFAAGVAIAVVILLVQLFSFQALGTPA
jgi:hypothetical protein